ncbi:hypothetical protein [Synechococcus sp. UW140]|uniref:hypothetical protein n=1 Tax=Synechococcus sp. UW140 TaxID=368503 RepID=UPI000E0FF30F|nr:hypothetical protein [Synechococcus sp. UW140]
MARTPQAIYRCPHCLSIHAQVADLGRTCPSCFKPLPADLAPAYYVTNPNPHRRSAIRAKQGMGVPLKLMAGLVLAVTFLPALGPDPMPSPSSPEEVVTRMPPHPF